MPEPENLDVLIARQGALGRITLNRPKAINALTLPMLRAIWRALEAWRTDESILAVAVDGAGTRGFCAGGDIRAIYASVQAADGMGDTFWREEYALNAVIAAYPKPYAVLMDGLVMGGGVGLSAHGSHRFVTESTALAMPETGIGFFPDVGGTWLLSRAPGELGAYLGLTGARIGFADAISCGFADRVIGTEVWPDLLAALARAATNNDVTALLLAASTRAEGSYLTQRQAGIDDAFSANSIEQILAALARQDTPFARETYRILAVRSPLALKVTLAALRRARNLGSLEDCLAMEARLAHAMSRQPDFLEGIRAAVIDKDQAPRWSPATLAQVSDEAVARILEGTVEQTP